MKFYQIRLTVYDPEADNYFSPQNIIGSCDEQTAIRIARKKWEDCGYNVREVFHCKEIFPTAVLCERAIFRHI